MLHPQTPVGIVPFSRLYFTGSGMVFLGVDVPGPASLTEWQGNSPGHASQAGTADIDRKLQPCLSAGLG